MSGIDLDALETLPGDIVPLPRETVIALVRRTEEAEAHCEGWRMTAATGEQTIARLTGERNETRARAESAEADRELLRSESAGLMRDLAGALGANPAEDLVDLAKRRMRELKQAEAAYARMCIDADEEAEGRESAEASLATLSTAYDALRARVVAVAGKAYGPHPVQTADEALDAIGRGVLEMQDDRAAADRAASTYQREMFALQDRVVSLTRGNADALARPPFDPAHVEVLRRMRDLLVRRLDGLDEDAPDHVAGGMREEIAAIEAVLGEGPTK